MLIFKFRQILVCNQLNKIVCCFCPDCFWLLSALLEYTAYNTLPSSLTNQEKITLPPILDLPERMEGQWTAICCRLPNFFAHEFSLLLLSRSKWDVHYICQKSLLSVFFFFVFYNLEPD